MKTDIMKTKENTTYYSSEFEEYLRVVKRMRKTADVEVWGGTQKYLRFHRMKRHDLAAYLRALGFKRNEV